MTANPAAEPARREVVARLVPARPVPGLDRMAALAARLLHVPHAQISLLGEVQRVAGGSGLAPDAVGGDTPLDQTVCAVAADAGAAFVVADARGDGRVRHLDAVVSGAVGAYLGVPLTSASGVRIGILCVFSPEPRAWTEADLTLLDDLAGPVVAELELAALSAEHEANLLQGQLAIDAARFGTYDWDLVTGAIRWNARLGELLGLEPGAAASMELFWERVHPDDREPLARDIDAARSSCGEFASEYRVALPDGGRRWVGSRGRVLCDPSGSPVRMLGAAFDTTEVRESRAQAARILATMATGFFAVDTEWRLTYLNAEGERILGRRFEDVRGRNLWSEFPGAEDLDFGRVYHRAMRTGQPEAFEEFYPAFGSWFEVRAQPTGEGLSVYFLDITARKEAQERAEAGARRLELLAEVAEELTGTLDLDDALDRLARTMVPRLGDWSVVTLVEDDSLRDVSCWHVDAEARPLVEAYVEERMAALRDTSYIATALRTGQPAVVEPDALVNLTRVLRPGRALDLVTVLAPYSGVVVPMIARGRTVGLVTLFSGAGRPPLSTEERAVAGDVAARAALVVDNAAAYVRAREAAAAAETASRWLGLLARVSEALSTTLDGVEAVERLARLVVPQLGDWCVVTVVAPDGELQEVARTQRDEVPDGAACPEVGALGAEALRTGGVAVARVPGLGSLTAVPLVARGRTLGVLTLVTTDGRGPLPHDELEAAVEVARRAALALDNVRLYDTQRSVAEELQRSLLTEPPEPDHVQVVVRYTPASEEAQVGGDWYDAFLQPAGATVLVIGDVVGHDMRAAAAMGQVRGLLRGIAYTTEAGPAEILSRLDAALEGLQVGTTATAVVARLEQTPDERERGISRLRWSNAGHPPAMAILPDGVVSVLAGVEADLLLGIDPQTGRQESEVVLDRGSTVFLYTDGLVERRGQSLDDGLVTLRELLGKLAGLPLDELCDEVLARMLPDEAEDDVALVAVRPHRQDRPRPPEAGPPRLPEHLRR